jgi:hypothetical protein
MGANAKLATHYYYNMHMCSCICFREFVVVFVCIRCLVVNYFLPKFHVAFFKNNRPIYLCVAYMHNREVLCMHANMLRLKVCCFFLENQVSLICVARSLGSYGNVVFAPQISGAGTFQNSEGILFSMRHMNELYRCSFILSTPSAFMEYI